MPASDIKFPLRIPVELDASIRGQAEKLGLSLNAFIVSRLSANYVDLEVSHVSDGVSNGVRGDVRKRGKGRDIAGVRSARSGKAPSESGAVDGGAQQDRGGKGKGKAEEGACPKCGKPLREWGNQLNCENCKQNFPK